ncbi:MAG: hypothetical protein ACKVQK_20120 [Burkholderiales bacterium]
MKLFTPEKIELLVVTSVSPHAEGLLIEGKIMGAMPMKAVLRPAELRKSLRLLSFRTLFALIGMLFRR